jgi:predicted nucleic acid-binding Zn ribbon protein
VSAGGSDRPRPRRRRRPPGVPGEEREPVALADALVAIGEELGLADPVAIGALADRWEEVVGPAVAHHARLRSLRGGVLTIAVDAAPWATELRYLEDALRTRVAEVAGADVVRSVRVVVEPRP